MLGHNFTSYMYSLLFFHSFPHRYLLTLSSTLISPLFSPLIAVDFFSTYLLPSPPLLISDPHSPAAPSPPPPPCPPHPAQIGRSKSPFQSPPPYQTSEETSIAAHAPLTHRGTVGEREGGREGGREGRSERGRERWGGRESRSLSKVRGN